MNALTVSARAMRATFALAALAASFSASALSITSSFNIDPSATDWAASAGTLKTGYLDRFNPALGTLDSVTYSFTGTLSSLVTVANDSTSTIPANVWSTVLGNFKLLDASGTFSLISLNVTSSTVQSTLGPSSSLPIFNQTATGTTGSLTLSSSFFSFVTGTSPMEFKIGARDDSTSNDDNGNAYAFFETLASAQGQVTYNYTPISTSPVPAPPASLALCVGALGTLRRRIARRK